MCLWDGGVGDGRWPPSKKYNGTVKKGKEGYCEGIGRHTSWNLLDKLIIKLRRNHIIIQQEIEIRMQTSKSLINLLLRSRHP